MDIVQLYKNKLPVYKTSGASWICIFHDHIPVFAVKRDFKNIYPAAMIIHFMDVRKTLIFLFLKPHFTFQESFSF